MIHQRERAKVRRDTSIKRGALLQTLTPLLVLRSDATLALRSA